MIDMNQHRRDFLKDAGIAAGILGFPFLNRIAEAADPKTTPLPKDYLALARQKMTEEKKQGVVIIVPTDVKQARQMENDLARLIGGHDASCALYPTKTTNFRTMPLGGGVAAAKMLFCQSVFVFLSQQEAAKEFPGMKEDTGVVLLDLDGKPIVTLPAAADLLGKSFVATFTNLIHGKDGQRLQTVVRAQRESLGKDASGQFDQAAANLQSDDFASRQKAQITLEELAPRTTSLLAALYRNRLPLESAARIERLFAGLFQAASVEKPSDRLPFGLHWMKITGGCGGSLFAKCGRSSTPPPSRLFLRFLSERRT